MLYKNDEKVDMSLDMKKRVYNELSVKYNDKDLAAGKFPKFNLVIKMPNSFYTQTPHNPKPDRPACAVIPLNAQIPGKDGTEKWNFCDIRTKNRDKDIYIYSANFQGKMQQHLEFTDSYTITEAKIDLAYFLLFISPMREIPEEHALAKAARGVKENQRFAFVVEQKEKEAALRISKNLLRSQIEMSILEAMPIDTVRFVASSLGVSNADKKGNLELRDELHTLVERMERNGNQGYEKFLEHSKMELTAEISAIIQQALDLGIIKEDQKNNKYVYTAKDGSAKSTITGAIAARTLRESIEYFMLSNPQEFEELKEAVETSKIMQEA